MMGWAKIRKGFIMGNGFRISKGLGLGALVLLTGPAAFAALDLGPAADFAVFQMGASGGGGKWNSSDATINGNVAFNDTSPGGNPNTIVNGNIEDPNVSPPNWTISGTSAQEPESTLNAFANEARAFSSAAAAFTSPSIGAVNGAQTYTFTAANLAQPGTYVVSTTSIDLNGGQDLVLNGAALPAGSRVIVNVSGDFKLNGGSAIILSGLTAAQVLFNYTGTHDAHLTGGSEFSGTLLAPNSTAAFDDEGAVINGSVIAASVNFSSHVTINGISFVPEPTSSIAGALLLLPFGAGALRMVHKC